MKLRLSMMFKKKNKNNEVVEPKLVEESTAELPKEDKPSETSET